MSNQRPLGEITKLLRYSDDPDDSRQLIIDFLDLTGHLRHSPDNPHRDPEITAKQLGSLSLQDDIVKGAIRSWQLVDGNVARQANAMHGGFRPDGDLGPASMNVLQMDRCGMPDHANHEAAGTGGWPKGCPWNPPQFKENHYIRIAERLQGAPAHWLADRERMNRELRENYALIGLVIEFVPWSQNNSEAEVNQIYRSIPGSTIGLGWYPNGTCQDSVDLHLDSDYRADYPRRRNLKKHEIGHCCGWQHFANTYMNPTNYPAYFEVDEPWRDNAATDRGAEMYGGERVDLEPEPGPGPGPDPEPPEDEAWRNVEVIVYGTHYLLTQKP